MGILIIRILAAELMFLVAPATVAGIVIANRAPRESGFWRVCFWTTFVSCVGQYAWALAPFKFLATKRYSFEEFFAPFLGWQLAAPPLLALLLWLVSRHRPAAPTRPVIVGLLFSVSAAVVFALPLGFTLQAVLGLGFEP